MDIIHIYFAIPVLSYILVLILMPPIKKIAVAVNLVDIPNFRKVHDNPVPLVGGIVIVISSGLALMISPEFWSDIKDYYVLIIGSVILLITGVIDDKMDLKPILKLIIQITLAYFVFNSGIRLESMFGVLGVYELPLGVQYLLTLSVIVGVINAFNMMDGIDGLAAGSAIIALSAFTFVAFLLGKTFLAILFISFIGALISFLRFNLSTNSKIFMGDAGTLVLGYILVVSGIILIQSAKDTSNISITVALIVGVLAIPVIDSLRVYRQRIKNGYSPFRADNTHFHHLVLHLELKHKWASFLIISIILFTVILSIILVKLINLTFMVFSILILFIVITLILGLIAEKNIWAKKIKKLEEF